MTPASLPPSYRMIRMAFSLLLLVTFGAAGGLLMVTGVIDAVVQGGVAFADAVRAAWEQI